MKRIDKKAYSKVVYETTILGLIIWTLKN